MKKKPKTFRDENGELFRFATWKENLIFSLIVWIGLAALIAAVCWSRHIYHCLFNH